MLQKSIKAELILENGQVFKGHAFGYAKEVVGEVVFTTAMGGYQEAITDPALAGQIVVMTYPLVGNYGINLEDMEADSPKLRALVVREKCDMPNNWRCEMTLDGFLNQHKIMGLTGIDTREVARVLRNNGTMKGIITTRVSDLSQSQIAQKFETFSMANAVKDVTTKEVKVIDGSGKHLAIVDLGAKKSLISQFANRGFKITIFPAFTSAEEILSANPDAVLYSGGPGGIDNIPSVVENAKALVGKKPLFGVCLGHLVVASALGATTSALKFGHRGANHPVKYLPTGKIYITSQSHAHVVNLDLPADLEADLEATFVSLNDGTIEGIRHKTLPIETVQFNLEASPGPSEAKFILDKFVKMM